MSKHGCTIIYALRNELSVLISDTSVDFFISNTSDDIHDSKYDYYKDTSEF